MKKLTKVFTTGVTVVAMSAMLLAGCGGTQSTASAEEGILTLSVNPEIQIAYDKAGLVTGLTGVNDDGKKIVDSYKDYVGKDCDAVVSGLIQEIYAAGYFVEEIEGDGKKIVIEMEEGSVVPDDDFLDDVSEEAEKTVKALKLHSNVTALDLDGNDVSHDDDDDDDDNDDQDDNDDNDDSDDDRDDNDDDDDKAAGVAGSNDDDDDDDRDDNDDDEDDDKKPAQKPAAPVKADDDDDNDDDQDDDNDDQDDQNDDNDDSDDQDDDNDDDQD